MKISEMTADQIHDMVKICDAAKEQAKWKLSHLRSIFDDHERSESEKTVRNFIAGCDAYKEMFEQMNKGKSA